MRETAIAQKFGSGQARVVVDDGDVDEVDELDDDELELDDDELELDDDELELDEELDVDDELE